MSPPVASLSLDLDNKWAYLRAAGNKDWEACESYLPKAVDRIVELLGELDLPLTVFVVGRDLEVDSDCQAIRSFERLREFEYANHSFNHLPWMHTMQRAEIVGEIERTHHALLDVTGQHAVGFRGPGFSCPEEVLRVLAERDYVYDASVFPTSLAPVARAVFLARTKLKGEEREKAKQLYGGFRAMRNPNRPYQRRVGSDDRLWEVPVSVMPITRTPIHFSYFTFLASFSVVAAKAYFRTALRLCRMTGTAPSLLLHPPDFLGCEDDREMAYFPGMKMSREKKLPIVRWALKRFAEKFDVRTMIGQLKSMDPSLRDRQTGSKDPSLPTPSLSFS